MLYSILFLNTQIEYEIYPKFKIIDKFTTELDMFEFTLKPIYEKLIFDFTKNNGLIPIVLKVNNQAYKYMYLTNYRSVNVAYNPKKYKYLIQAISPTFKLQRIVLPNKLITQPLLDYKRTVFEEFIKILEVYGNDELGYNGNLETLLDKPCPELQFTKSTLHEALIALFGVCGLAPKMNAFGIIDYIDLKAIDTRNWSLDIFIREETSNGIENYADAFDYDVENAISNEQDITTQWILPTSEEALITDDNFIWKTPSNIYEIEKVKLAVDGGFSVERKNGTSTLDVVDLVVNNLDITDYVVSKEIYDTLKVSSAVSEDGEDFKRNNLYYENNIIGGGAFSEKTWIASLPSEKALTNIVNLVIDKMGYILKSSGNETDLRKYMLKVTYKSQSANMRFKVVKENVEKPNNSMISNQDDAYIDVINFGNQKQEFINRTGNELITMQLNKSLSDLNNIYSLDIPDLGDRIDKDYIVTQRKMQFNENNVLVNYYLAKDYIYLTGYSGLNQIKRFTSIDTKNTVIRNDAFLYNYKLEFLNSENNDYLVNKFFNNYGTKNDNGMTMHYIQTLNSNNQYLQDYYILVNSDNKQIGNSIVCNFQFESNVKVGDSIEVDGNAHLKHPIKYTDNNGEFRTLQVYFGAGEGYRDIKDFDVIKLLPKVEYSEIMPYIGDSHTYLLNKDNREITSITMQFRVFGDNKGIVVYNDFLKHSQLIKNNENVEYKIYAKPFANHNDFLNEKYKTTTIIPNGEFLENATLNISSNEIELTISELSTNDERYWTIGVCDQYDNLLFALNYTKQNQLPTIKLYLNKK